MVSEVGVSVYDSMCNLDNGIPIQNLTSYGLAHSLARGLACGLLILRNLADTIQELEPTTLLGIYNNRTRLSVNCLLPP